MLIDVRTTLAHRSFNPSASTIYIQSEWTILICTSFCRRLNFSRSANRRLVTTRKSCTQFPDESNRLIQRSRFTFNSPGTTNSMSINWPKKYTNHLVRCFETIFRRVYKLNEHTFICHEVRREFHLIEAAIKCWRYHLRRTALIDNPHKIENMIAPQERTTSMPSEYMSASIVARSSWLLCTKRAH